MIHIHKLVVVACVCVFTASNSIKGSKLGLCVRVFTASNNTEGSKLGLCVCLLQATILRDLS